MEALYEHVLLSNDTGERLVLQNAPVGWDEQKFNLIRDLTYFGVFKKISVEYEFVGDGYELLQRHILRMGVDANVIMRVYKDHVFLFEGKINFLVAKDFRRTRKFVVDIIQSSFVQKFQTRENMKLNIFNTSSLDRREIPPAVLKTATIRGKRIEFHTLFDGIASTEPYEYHHVIPFIIKTNGNDGAQMPSGIAIDNNGGVPGVNDYPNPPEDLKDIDCAFFINKLTESQVIEINWNVEFTAMYLGVGPPWNIGGSNGANFYHQRRMIIRLYNSEGELVDVVYHQLLETAFGFQTCVGSATIEVPPGHYCVFSNEQCQRLFDLDSNSNFFDNFLQPFQNMDGELKTQYKYPKVEMKIVNDSAVSDTDVPVLLPFELFSNLVSQMTDGIFESKFFGRPDVGYEEMGEGALLAITVGELLRGIPLEEVQIATSFRDAFVSYSSVFCLGAIIQKNTVIVEPLGELFNTRIATDLGEVKDLVCSPATDFIFNSVLAGYPLNEYSEENGRDEFNTQIQFSNSISAAKKELPLLSVYYGDGYGVEFARRLNVRFTGTKDSKYDGKIFFIDLIDDEGTLKSRRLEGILLAEGIFSPETAMNLRIAIEQNMMRWGRYLNIAVNKKPDMNYYPQSKEKNNTLRVITDLGETVSGDPVKTNGTAYFIPSERNFECPVKLNNLFEILANPLGLVKYKYEDEDFFDYLFECDMETEKHKGPWRMLATRDSPIDKSEQTWGNYLKYNDGPTDFIQFEVNSQEAVLEYK